MKVFIVDIKPGLSDHLPHGQFLAALFLRFLKLLQGVLDLTATCSGLVLAASLGFAAAVLQM